LSRSAVLVLAAALTLPPLSAHAQRSSLDVRIVDGGASLVVGDVLDDAALADALESGLPLRLRFRLELWRDRFFDELVDRSDWQTILALEPLERRYLLAAENPAGSAAYGSYAQVRAAVSRPQPPRLRPPGPGQYYYLATLEIETLSLSDLEELGHWLRGELGPALQGQRTVVGALGTGVRRAFIRVLRLPTRKYQARTEIFRID
jgi:hypothetical protein